MDCLDVQVARLCEQEMQLALRLSQAQPHQYTEAVYDMCDGLAGVLESEMTAIRKMHYAVVSFKQAHPPR